MKPLIMYAFPGPTNGKIRTLNLEYLLYASTEVLEADATFTLGVKQLYDAHDLL